MMRILFLICTLLFPLFAKEVCIKNFDKDICGDFKLLKSVIVKSSLSKQELKERLDTPLKQIGFLKDSSLYLIDSKKPLEYSRELSKKDFIIYAQPNISQVKNNSFIRTENLKNRYGLKKVWKTTMGGGVNIAIIDDGFDLSHKDLKNINLLFSYDADNKTLTSNPKVNLDTHGTQVAGVIFAAHNGMGPDGIAPEANLIAIRQTTNITADTVLAFTVAKKAGARIINCSWNSPILLEPVYDTIKDITKDTAVVFAAGNEHKKISPLSIEASIPEVITVGAVQRYSNYGDMVDFIIPSNIYTTKSNGKFGNFGGTSATAPVISGLLALEIAKNPAKNYKESVKILKKELKK